MANVYNVTKCKFITVGKISDILDITVCIHILVITPFQLAIDQETDLGVVFENSLKFANQASQSVCQANRIIGVIKKSFCNLDPHIFRSLYFSLVRPILTI